MQENQKNIYKPAPIAPGETVLEVLEFFKMSQKELAERMGRPLKLINEIIKGKAAITQETALQLENVLGKEAAFWNNLEAGYQEAVARCALEKELGTEIESALAYPYKEMENHGWVPAAIDQIDIVKNLLTFFGVSSLGNVVENKLLEPALYKMSLKKKADPLALAAWLRKGTIDAQQIETKPFSENLLKEKVNHIRCLTQKKPDVFLEKIKKHLAEAGVAFVITKSLTNVPVNGASRWLGSDTAVVQLSIYGKYADKFWFSLFHEIGHILKHGKKEYNIDINNSPVDIKEAEANEYAKDALIPSEKYLKFINSSELSANSVISFAKELGIQPGIVVGRLQFEQRIGFNQLNGLKTKYEWKN